MGFIEFPMGGWGVVKKRESPDFSSPEVGISVIGWPVSKLIFLLGLCCGCQRCYGTKLNIKELSFPYFFNHCKIQ